MNEKDIKIIEKYIQNKTVSQESIKRIWSSLRQFQKFLNKSFVELIEETKLKQLSYLKETEIINEKGERETVPAYIEADIENGDLAKIFKEFYFHESNRGLSDVSIDTYIGDVRPFLKKNKDSNYQNHQALIIILIQKNH